MNKTKKWQYKHKHISTILPSLMRRVGVCNYVREKIITPDNDFFHVDQLQSLAHDKALVLLHGLEGSSKEHYILAHAQHLYNHGFDIFAMNFRSCSGEMNSTSRLYHSGDTEDLRLLLTKLENNIKYKAIGILGFSLGGNVLLKYLGEDPKKVGKKVKAAISVSVPLDLKGCSYQLARGFNRIYSLYFMWSLRKKVRYLQKKHQVDGLKGVKTSQLKTFLDFDELVTAPLHGFRGCEDYWSQASSKQFLKNIQTPTLIINAQNDPFLSSECYPTEQELNNYFLTLQYPKYGGHVGFIQDALCNKSYIEEESLKFFNKTLGA